MANLVYNIRVPRTPRILRGAVRHQVRQELVQTAAGSATSRLRRAASAAITYQPLSGKYPLLEYWFMYRPHIHKCIHSIIIL